MAVPEGQFGSGSRVPRGGSRGDEFGILSWIESKMTAPIRALEERSQEIADAGVEAVQSIIVQKDRIDTEAMLNGVTSEVTSSRVEGMVNIKVGWNLSDYRHGYPELQDQGFQQVEGMQALAYGQMVMEQVADKVIKEAGRRS